VTATLSFVSPAVDADNGTILTRAVLPADSGLRPGQFVQLKIITAVHTHCLAAPAESVVTDINGQNVIALVNGDAALQTPVQTGFRENGWVEITGAGLKEGDSLVTVGAYGLPEKTKIRVANPPAGETSATNPKPAGSFRHAARDFHHVHCGGLVPCRCFCGVAHAVVGVSADRFPARRHSGGQRHHARRRNDGHHHTPH